MHWCTSCHAGCCKVPGSTSRTAVEGSNLKELSGSLATQGCVSRKPPHTAKKSLLLRAELSTALWNKQGVNSVQSNGHLARAQILLAKGSRRNNPSCKIVYTDKPPSRSRCIALQTPERLHNKCGKESCQLRQRRLTAQAQPYSAIQLERGSASMFASKLGSKAQALIAVLLS